LSKASNFGSRVSEIHQGSGRFTFKGDAPSSGVHTSDGKLYCGTYSPSRWFSDELKPFHDQIREFRDKHGTGGSKKSKSTGGNPHQAKNANRKLQQLKTQNEALKRNLSALKAGEKDNVTDEPVEQTPDNAGDAFGGQQSMKKKAK
jgi:hypothetical protein